MIPRGQSGDSGVNKIKRIRNSTKNHLSKWSIINGSTVNFIRIKDNQCTLLIVEDEKENTPQSVILK